jgi:SNF2 family DNA or RNA helicase
MMNFKTLPYKHQKSGAEIISELPLFCFGDEMGTGKSKMIVDGVCHLHEQEKIDAAIIICPNGVKTNWTDPEEGQIVKHGWDHLHHQVYTIYASRKLYPVDTLPKGILHWIIVNYESCWRRKTEPWLMQFMKRFNTALILDESHKIKSHTAMQTKGCIRLAPYAKRRYIMSGTLITTNPLNYWTQFRFLDQNILGHRTYTSMRIAHAVLEEKQARGKTFKVDVGYKDVDVILKKVAPFYRRVEKKDCLDLPPKVYEKREVELSDEQVEAYNSMKDKLVAEYAGKRFKAPIALTKVLRLMQISSGYLSDGTDITWMKDSPKANAAVDLVKEHSGKSVIFFREHAELDILKKGLIKAEIPYLTLHGKMDVASREAAKQSFQKDDIHTVILVQIATGGIGIDLTRASLCIYISNSYSWEHRVQSEDRLHRPGQYHSVTYVDLLATCKGKQTFDHQALRSLEHKEGLAKLLLKNEASMDEFLDTL